MNFQDCEDYEIGGGDLVPADFVKPGVLQSWVGFVGLLLAVVACVGGWGFFFYCIWCGLARVLR